MGAPTQVEKDVADWWRQLYKIGKSLFGLSGPISVVEHVKAKLNAFKAHLPFMAAITHPGMRDRHWRALVEQVPSSIAILYYYFTTLLLAYPTVGWVGCGWVALEAVGGFGRGVRLPLARLE